MFRAIGDDESGFRGFDAIGESLLTMFVHMSGDGGMNGLPDTLNDATTLNRWLVWGFFGVCTSLRTWPLHHIVARERGPCAGVTWSKATGASEIRICGHVRVGGLRTGWCEASESGLVVAPHRLVSSASCPVS